MHDKGEEHRDIGGDKGEAPFDLGGAQPPLARRPARLLQRQSRPGGGKRLHAHARLYPCRPAANPGISLARIGSSGE
jgi:hypothetical protein